MSTPLFSGFQFSVIADHIIKVNDLVTFQPSYRNYSTGCKVVEILSDGSYVLQVTGLDTTAPDWGMRFVADASQVFPAV